MVERLSEQCGLDRVPSLPVLGNEQAFTLIGWSIGCPVKSGRTAACLGNEKRPRNMVPGFGAPKQCEVLPACCNRGVLMAGATKAWQDLSNLVPAGLDLCAQRGWQKTSQHGPAQLMCRGACPRGDDSFAAQVRTAALFGHSDLVRQRVQHPTGYGFTTPHKRDHDGEARLALDEIRCAVKGVNRSGPGCLNNLPPSFKWTPGGLPTVQSCPRRRWSLATNRPTRWATRGAPGISFYAASASFGTRSS